MAWDRTITRPRWPPGCAAQTNNVLTTTTQHDGPARLRHLPAQCSRHPTGLAVGPPDDYSQVRGALVNLGGQVTRQELNISHYMLFGLRDADSSQPDLSHQFGITRHDYTPKPAYQTFKTLIKQLGPDLC